MGLRGLDLASELGSQRRNRMGRMAATREALADVFSQMLLGGQ
jgi:hypothetical protein